MFKVIDISTFQGDVDFSQIKGAVDGVIIRCGYGDNLSSQDDEWFYHNVTECEKYDIPYGIYLYSYATNADHVESETDHLLRCLSRCKKLSFPAYIDLEDNSIRSYFKPDWYIRMGEAVERAGYWFGVYANKDWFVNVIGDTLDRFTKWVAQYNNVCDYAGTYDMWQYTSMGNVPGISGGVDMNICYKDFPSILAGETEEAGEPEDGHAVYTMDYVNMRKEAYVGSPVLTTVPPRTLLTVLADDGFGWSKVTYQGKVGWLCNLYVNGGQSACKRITVNGDNVNVRSGPGLSYPVILQMFNGDDITLVSQDTDTGWGYIKHNDTYGYCYLDWSYLTLRT